MFTPTNRYAVAEPDGLRLYATDLPWIGNGTLYPSIGPQPDAELAGWGFDVVDRYGEPTTADAYAGISPLRPPEPRKQVGPLLNYDFTLDGLRGVDINDLASVTRPVAAAMAAVGIQTVHDLLHQLPRRYLDLAHPQPATSAVAGDTVTVVGVITKLVVPPQAASPVIATVRDSSGVLLSCRWFNQRFIARRLRVGGRVIMLGKLEEFGSASRRGLGMTNPLAEALDAEQSNLAGRLVGIYPASMKHDLSTWAMFRAASEAVERLGDLTDPVPADLAASHGLPTRGDAYKMVHDPDTVADAKRGRDRLAYDELLRLQLVLAAGRASLKAEDAYSHRTPGLLVESYLASLPYQLTGAQQRAFAEIATDMAAPTPMSRLLMGDVGSGKTVVSALMLALAVESGFQGALIAPTEILATQHFSELSDSLSTMVGPDGAPVKVGCLTTKVTGKARRELLAGLADGNIDVVVGTHALLDARVKFAHLSAVVVDEQHRFGVDQRRALRDKGNGRTPDMLYASATPIPRTTAMTVFGDLDVSVLDEMPPGRTPVRTFHLTDVNAAVDGAAWAAIRDQVAQGRQAFVVTPLVEKSLTREDAAAHSTANDLANGPLAGLRIAVVTGKDKPDERRAAMDSFAQGEIDVLVATTVIEVGVNVPNATIMVVLGADKFGLAQLHQIRGRVGRGRFPGACFLAADPKTSTGRERMEAMVSTTDGFVLAERDLEIRGTGSMAGTGQSGGARDLHIASVLGDRELLEAAKADAAALTAGDPGLRRRPGLRAEVLNAIGEEGAGWLRSV